MRNLGTTKWYGSDLGNETEWQREAESRLTETEGDSEVDGLLTETLGAVDSPVLVSTPHRVLSEGREGCVSPTNRVCSVSRRPRSGRGDSL